MFASMEIVHAQTFFLNVLVYFFKILLFRNNFIFIEFEPLNKYCSFWCL